MIFQLAMALLTVQSPTPSAVRTYRQGSYLYIESSHDRDTLRVAIDKAWGGAIVAVTLDTNQFINSWDAGREIQIAMYDGFDSYDGCGGCKGVAGWNPTQAGDRYRHGSAVIQDSLARDHIYVRTVPVDWFPDNKGGGAQDPVRSDILMEQWISVSKYDWRVIHIHYRVTNLGKVAHGNTIQELPSVYVQPEYSRFVYYAGTAPWTSAAVVDTVLPVAPAPLPTLHMPERWAALVNPTGVGITVYVPEQYPYGGGRRIVGAGKPKNWNSVYYRPLVYSSLLPHQVLDEDVFVIPGPYPVARAILTSLRDSLRTADGTAPFGRVDSPKANATVAGSMQVTGWALDNDCVDRVDVFIDGMRLGSAEYGVSRPDLQTPYVGAPPGAGFRYTLDTRKVANGPHTIRVQIVDRSGNVALLKDISVLVKN